VALSEQINITSFYIRQISPMACKRIVVIDDSKLVLAVVSDALQGAGFEVMATDSGIEANQHIYASKRPDLILIDIMMPLLNGDRKVKLLKERESSRHIPILLMSSKPLEELVAICRESGADGYLQKPFDGPTLVRKVQELLSA
jgi:CheY-like chemotaxis protein